MRRGQGLGEPKKGIGVGANQKWKSSPCLLFVDHDVVRRDLPQSPGVFFPAKTGGARDARRVFYKTLPISDMSLLADRQAEAELQALRRAVNHTFTTLDVARRKWNKLSSVGKEALTACANGQSRLGHAQGAHLTAALQRLDSTAARGRSYSSMRRGVATYALRERRDAQLAVPPVLDGLEEVVGSMRHAVADLEARVAASTRAIGAERARSTPLVHTETAAQLVARASAMADCFEQELKLRRTVAAQVAGGGREGAATKPGWDGAVKLYLSAWVLEPYIDHDVLDALLPALGGDEQPVRMR